MTLAGRVAVVAGAGRGIGRAVALAFARAGASVVLASRSVAELESVARQVGAIGAPALVVPTDVTEEASVAALVRQGASTFGRLDVLAMAAGVGIFGPATGCATEQWDRTMAVNLRGAFLLCREVLPHMMAQGRGTIIAMGSMVTGRTLPNSAAYTASKYGLLGLARVLSEEMRPHGIRVGVITAGAVDTPLWDSVPNPPDRSRMLTPEQVAEAALLIATLAPNASLEEMTLMPSAGVL
jgi:NAD(P)-dependent dehydrogenase (short-subunit alcohol dehydrogenase family)